MTGRAVACAAGLAVLLTACGDPASDATTARSAAPVAAARASIAPPALTPEVRTHLERGNSAVGLGDWAIALGHYEAAVDADSTAGAAWFGVWMSLTELGETDRAAEARARVTQLGRPVPGDPHAITPADTSRYDTPPQEEGA